MMNLTYKRHFYLWLLLVGCLACLALTMGDQTIVTYSMNLPLGTVLESAWAVALAMF